MLKFTTVITVNYIVINGMKPNDLYCGWPWVFWLFQNGLTSHARELCLLMSDGQILYACGPKPYLMCISLKSVQLVHGVQAI